MCPAGLCGLGPALALSGPCLSRLGSWFLGPGTLPLLDRWWKLLGVKQKGGGATPALLQRPQEPSLGLAFRHSEPGQGGPAGDPPWGSRRGSQTPSSGTRIALPLSSSASCPLESHPSPAATTQGSPLTAPATSRALPGLRELWPPGDGRSPRAAMTGRDQTRHSLWPPSLPCAVFGDCPLSTGIQSAPS